MEHPTRAARSRVTESRHALRLALLALSVGAVAVPEGGFAQATSRGNGRVLHRQLPGDAPIDEEHLTPPSAAGSLASNGHTSGEPAARPRAQNASPTREMDRQTHAPPGAQLSYTEVFTPSVAPFKRLQAYDAINDAGELYVRDPTLHRLEVGEDEVPGHWGSGPRARFTGEIDIEIATDGPTPIPGVAGEERVVSYETTPSQVLQFSHDSAGNLYVRGNVSAVVHLTYLLEAPQSAFSVASVPDVSISTANNQIDSTLRPSTPLWLEARAREVLDRRELRITRGDRLDESLGKLVAYFRSFRDAELEHASSERGPQVYTDLANGGVGACRHRAYGLMPTLLALGMPARYVGNEAHAWVEVFITRRGWTRVDLGGWEVRMNMQVPTSREQFHPQNPDVFPQPRDYSAGYSQTAANANSLNANPGNGASQGPTGARANNPMFAGATPGDGRAQPSAAASAAAPSANGQRNDSQNANAQRGANGGGGNGGGGNGGGGNGNGGGGNGGRGNGARGERRASLGERIADMLRGPSREGDANDANEPEPRENTRLLRVSLRVRSVDADERGGSSPATGTFVRGSMVRVRGDASEESGRGAAGLPIEVRMGRDRAHASPIGSTVTREDGTWELHAVLPAGLDAGDYEVLANTPGDALREPGRSE